MGRHLVSVTLGESTADVARPGAEVGVAGFGFQAAAFDKVIGLAKTATARCDQFSYWFHGEDSDGDRCLAVDFRAEQPVRDRESYGAVRCGSLGPAESGVVETWFAGGEHRGAVGV